MNGQIDRWRDSEIDAAGGGGNISLLLPLLDAGHSADLGEDSIVCGSRILDTYTNPSCIKIDS